MENTKRNFFSISRRDLASLPILVFAPLLAYHYPSLLIFIVLLYLIAGIITGYVWPCVTTLLGAVFIGLFFGPSVNGDVYQDIVRFSLGAVLGLAFGMLLHELRQDKPEKPD